MNRHNIYGRPSITPRSYVIRLMECLLGAEYEIEKCHPDTMLLLCSSGFINVIKVELGETACYTWAVKCCPATSDCVRPSSSGHRRHVRNICNGQKICGVNTTAETNECSRWYTEFERITYECVRKYILKLYYNFIIAFTDRLRFILDIVRVMKLVRP